MLVCSHLLRGIVARQHLCHGTHRGILVADRDVCTSLRIGGIGLHFTGSIQSRCRLIKSKGYH